ncbi:hypothetical protein [Streptomyces sp. NPDC048551]|uniref:hypothetical protein n=1 Tax=Streptomyces sp. NPDC048551 TaxID=3155758 RepID=UPI0034339949
MIIEWAILALTVLAAGTSIRAVTSRRAVRRATGALAGVEVAIPCRVAWKDGLGRHGFMYRKLTRQSHGSVFKRPARRPVTLPVGGRALLGPSWRPGMQVFEYRAPGGEELRLQCYEAEAHLVATLLRIPDPTDYT